MIQRLERGLQGKCRLVAIVQAASTLYQSHNVLTCKSDDLGGATEHHPIHSDLAGVLASIRQTERREEESWSCANYTAILPPLVGRGSNGIISSSDFTGERVALS